MLLFVCRYFSFGTLLVMLLMLVSLVIVSDFNSIETLILLGLSFLDI
jgi:voltage-gated potassium channel Kch